jgi:hypothetical protein
MVEGIVLKNARIKFDVARGADQTLTVDVPGATLAEQIENLEAYAKDAQANIESLGELKVKKVQIEFGANSIFDIGSIFR